MTIQEKTIQQSIPARLKHSCNAISWDFTANTSSVKIWG